MDEKTCDRKENSRYEITELMCRFHGAGLYKFDPQSQRTLSTVQKLTLDRLTGESFILIKGITLRQLDVLKGDSCDHISAPPGTTVILSGQICVSIVLPYLFIVRIHHTCTNYNRRVCFST